MNIKQLIPFLSALSLSFNNAPAWTLIEDFQKYENPSEIKGSWNTESSEAGLYLMSDPTDETNTVLHIFTGEIGVDWANTHLTLPIPNEAVLGPGKIATLYWRAYEVGTDNNWGVGFTDKDAVSSWDDYNIIIKVSETSIVTAHHRRSYQAANPPIILETGVWNHFWLVVNYDAQTYSLWVKRPQDIEPIQQSIGRNGETDLTFRRPPNGELRHFVLTSTSESPGAPNAGELFYLDDFYIHPGETHTIPPFQAKEK